MIIGGLLFSACEEDPLIQTDGFQTKPVIFSIIDSEDTAHLIRLGRFFSGISDPGVTAGIPDSIYFRSAGLKVSLRKRNGARIDVPAELVNVPDKYPGMFTDEDYRVFRFSKRLTMGEYPFQGLIYDSVFMEFQIPGLPAARCSTSLVWPPRIWSPLQAQNYIYIYPDNPMRVLWSGDAWNEIDVSFKIHEQFTDTTLTQTFYIQKTNDIHWNGKYYEIKVPYELIYQILDTHLKVRNDLIRRYFGPFRIDILTGNNDFATFMKYREGINDFNFNPLFNVDNGLGMLSGKASIIKTEMHLDQPSRLHFASDPGLRKYNFIEY